MQAFVLAAGKGERLLPYTRFVPKPLFHLLGKPLLEIIFDSLRRLGFRRIGLNVHHLAGQIKEFVAFYQRRHPEIYFEIFEEKEILGPVGAFLGARKFFTEDTLVINADVVTNFPLRALLEAHRRLGGIATLLLHRHPEFNKILLSGDEVRGFRPKAEEAFAYTGLKVITPEFVKLLPEGAREFVPAYQELLKKGASIKALVGTSFYWQDIGTLKSYLKTLEDLLLKRAVIQGLEPPSGPFEIPSEVSQEGVIFEDWVFLEEGVHLSPGTKLRRVVAWRGAKIPPGLHQDKLFISGAEDL